MKKYIGKKQLTFLITLLCVATIIGYVVGRRNAVVGGIIYKIDGSEPVYLIVTNKEKTKWLFPKGKVKILESKITSLSREVEEEAGVIADVQFKLKGNPFIFRKQSGKYQEVTYFAMKHKIDLVDWKEKNIRYKQWINYSEATLTLDNELVRALHEVDNNLPKKK